MMTRASSSAQAPHSDLLNCRGSHIPEEWPSAVHARDGGRHGKQFPESSSRQIVGAWSGSTPLLEVIEPFLRRPAAGDEADCFCVPGKGRRVKLKLQVSSRPRRTTFPSGSRRRSSRIQFIGITKLK